MIPPQIPHKNLIASAFVALVIISVGVYMKRDAIVIPESRVTSPTKIATSTDTKNTDFTTRDTDADGLLDWEENLKGTDPFKEDTDGDGTYDGKELALNRDPLKKGPNDKLPEIQRSLLGTSTDLAGIKKEYFEKYLKEESKKIRQDTFKQVVKSVDYEKFKPTYEILDLKLTADSGTESLRKYGNEIVTLTRKYAGTAPRLEEEIFASASATKKDADLKDLQYIIIIYENLTKDLLAMTVPMPFAEPHLLLVTGYDGLARGLRGMLKLYSNPVEGATGYQTYTFYRNEVAMGYAGVIGGLSMSGVMFERSEPGFAIYKFYTESIDNIEVGDEEELSTIE